jgi:membrane-associated phospholipid phosphatase
MDTTLDWISNHALTVWALLLALALIVGDLAWLRAARRRRRIEDAGAVHRVLGPLTVAVFVLALALVFAAIAVAVSHGHDELTLIDTALAEDLKTNLSQPVLRAIAVLTQFGNPLLLAGASAVVTLALLWRRHWQLAFSWVSALAGTAVINQVLKRIFQRQRPLHEHGFIIEHSYSFPSGHASGAMVFYGMAAYLLLRLTPLHLHRPIIAAAITAISVIGISRILLQVHYLSDVIAGYLTGLAWLLLCIGAAEYLRLRRGAAKGIRPS